MTMQQQTGQIAVGVDGTDAGLVAVEFAVREASMRKTSIVLVHSYHVAAGLNPMFPWYGLGSLRETGEQALHDAARLVHRTDERIRTSTVLTPGTAAAALVQASERSAMVVIGRRAIKRVHRIVSGATAAAVAARSKAPVVSVPASWSNQLSQDRIVVGVDGSAAGRDALAFAFGEASRRSAELVAFRNWEVPVQWYTDLMDLDAGYRDWLEFARLSLAEDVAGWQEQYPGVRVVKIFEQSQTPAEGLLREAEKASLLVVGARGLGGVPGLHVGWTARTVLAHAPCPIVIVHQGARHRTEDRHPAAAAQV